MNYFNKIPLKYIINSLLSKHCVIKTDEQNNLMRDK